jgi:hypothetical protein
MVEGGRARGGGAGIGVVDDRRAEAAAGSKLQTGAGPRIPGQPEIADQAVVIRAIGILELDEAVAERGRGVDGAAGFVAGAEACADDLAVPPIAVIGDIFIEGRVTIARPRKEGEAIGGGIGSLGVGADGGAVAVVEVAAFGVQSRNAGADAVADGIAGDVVAEPRIEQIDRQIVPIVLGIDGLVVLGIATVADRRVDLPLPGQIDPAVGPDAPIHIVLGAVLDGGGGAAAGLEPEAVARVQGLGAQRRREGEKDVSVLLPWAGAHNARVARMQL